MELDRTTALCYFLRFLAGNPDGDAATRALVLGALAPLHAIGAQIYAHDRETTLELAGNYGLDEEIGSAFRALPISMPMPLCEAFVTLNPVVVPSEQLVERYPIFSAEPSLLEGGMLGTEPGMIAVVPILNSGVAIGAVSMLIPGRDELEPADWQYIDGAMAGVSMWLNNQREILVDRWRRAAPSPQREVRITERQREILELVGLDRTNGEIARSLGYSVPTIKKDLQLLMKMLSTHDRRSTAGRAREIGLLPERRRGE